MALDYRKCAQEIADNIGGGANVVSAAHCATRLRLVIADNGKVNKEALENVDGVKGMFESNGQLQLIIGTGTVNKVYDEFLSITPAPLTRSTTSSFPSQAHPLHPRKMSRQQPLQSSPGTSACSNPSATYSSRSCPLSLLPVL